MPAELGINVAPDADPRALEATGTRWVRCVYRRPGTSEFPAILPWALELQRQHIELVMVGDSSPNSLGRDPAQWEEAMTRARYELGDIVTWWQWFNEPDGTGMASWTMSHAEVNRGLAIARRVFPRELGWRLAAPGLVSGDTNWPWSLRLDYCDALDAHPYNKYLHDAAHERELREMLERYRDVARHFGIDLWLGEYDSRTRGLSTYLRDFPGVSRAAVMAWDNAMTNAEGLALGLLQNPAAMADFTAAATGQAHHPPANQHAEFVLGFARWHNLEPARIGDALTNERTVAPEWQIQPTSNGVLSWVAGKGHAFVQHDGRIFRWQEDWDASREVPA